MKIEIKNFGPIDHFEFDLEKDLHIIYGENNIGKSYAISAVYLILKAWKEIVLFSTLDEISDLPQSNENEPYKINAELDANLNMAFSNTFSELKNLYSDKDPEITIHSKILDIFWKREIDSNSPYYLKGNYTPNKKAINTSDEIHFLVYKNPLLGFENLFFLPASRSGMYQIMSNLGIIIAEISQYRNRLVDKNIPFFNLSQPVSEYFINLSSIKSNSLSNYETLVNKLEKEVIEGEVIFDEFKKKLTYKSKKNNLSLELNEVSSMIAEIAPLVAHLKYLLPKSNTILFIEEPEAHLHPKIQVEMMKIFVDLAKAGVKVVMTTHSDFMMNELTNLILEKKIAAEKVGSYHLVMGKNGSYDAEDMKATSEGIMDYNFADTAIEQYERRMNILEKLNQEHAFTEN